MSLTETFHYHSKALAAKSSALEVIHHAGDRGTEREDILEEFLAPLLPERLNIGRGEIRATNGSWSKQEDLIIYDRLNCPRLFVGTRSQVSPVESVAAVIEVKTSLGTNEIKDATANIARARSLQKTGMSTHIGAGSIGFGAPTPVMGVLFAFGLNLSVDTFRQRWEEAQSAMPPEQRINLTCILDKTTIVHVDKTFHLWDQTDRPMLHSFIAMDTKADSLFVFTLCLMRALAEARFGIPDLLKYYLSGGERLRFGFLYKE